MSDDKMANKLAGVIGFFDDPESCLDAMRKVRSENYENFDAYTPFPIHGMDEAQGLTRSKVPWVSLAAGITGCSLALLLQWWTSAVDWPLNVGGKPMFSWQAFVPVTFEGTILFAGLCTFGALVFFCKLPNKRRIFDPSITNNRFAIAIEAPSSIDEEEEEAVARRKRFKSFQPEEAMEVLKRAGAKDTRKVYEEGWF